jgi:hypothetical protein
MAEDVLMDYAVVQTMANTLGTASSVLNTVNGILSTVEAVLIGSAFVGVIGAAAAAYVDDIRSAVSSVETLCDTTNKEVNDAIKAIRDGDTTGSSHFV